MPKIYKAVEGSHLSDTQAQIIGERLDVLGGTEQVLTPKIVLDDARNAESPLHNFFEWDNGLAAEHYRRQQASYLLRNIVVVRVKPIQVGAVEAPCVRVRSWHAVKEGETKRYVHSDRIATDTNLRNQVIANALSELLGWKRRYATYVEEFGSVLNAIDALPELPLGEQNEKLDIFELAA